MIKTIPQQINPTRYEPQPNTSWGASLSGDYPNINKNKATIFIPTTTGVNTYNHHQQCCQFYGDDCHLIWSTHEQDEKGYGSRIRYSKSVDNGINWSTPVVLLEAQDDSTKSYLTNNGRQSIACGFAEYNNELYALISVDKLLATTSGGAPRSGVGILAVKINSNATFDTPVWIDTPVGDFVAPNPVNGFPSYFFDVALRSNLRSGLINKQFLFNQVSYFSCSTEDPIYSRDEFNGNVLAEPSVALFPNGQYVKAWKGSDGSSGNSNFSVYQTSLNQIKWELPYTTNIPDVNTRKRILKTNLNNVVYVGNNQGTTRDPLFLAVSNDGFNYELNNVYNIDKTTYGAQFSGEGKGRGAQHPAIWQLNNNKLMVCYNWNKEEVYCATLDIPTI